MDQSILRQVRNEVNQGIEAVRNGRADLADSLFFSALNNLSTVVDDRLRRNELSMLSEIFDRCGFAEFALQAAEDSVEIDRKLGLKSQLPQDIIAIGNALMNLGNTTTAEERFKEALGMLLEAKDMANAASANTNLANIVANRGEHQRAIEMLEKSLEYLQQEPFENTELNTRFALMQLFEFVDGDVKRAVNNAREICDRFLDDMPTQQQQMVETFVAKVAARYLTANPGTDPDKWKSDTFPELY